MKGEEMVTVKKALIPEVVADDEIEPVQDHLSGSEAKRVAIARQIWNLLRRSKSDIYQIGRLLSEAKRIDIKHGQFQKWIETTFEKQLPLSTAANYMAIYEVCGDKPEMIQYFPITVLMCFIQRAFPEELINKVKEDPEKYSKLIEPKKLKEGFKAYKEAKTKEDKKNTLQLLCAILDNTKSDPHVAYKLLCDDYLRLEFQNVTKQMDVGFSKINSGINFVNKMDEMNQKGIVRQMLLFRERYNEEFDKRIATLQRMKDTFNDALDEFQKSGASNL